MSYTLQELREDVRGLMDGGGSGGPITFVNSFGDDGGSILAYDATGREIMILEGGDGSLTDARLQIYGAGDATYPNFLHYYGAHWTYHSIAGTRLVELSDDGEMKFHEVPSTGGQIRLSTGSDVDSVLLRNDGSSFYLLITDTQDGGFNADRPFSMNLGTGLITMAEGLTITNGDLLLASGQELQWNNGDHLRYDDGTNVFQFSADGSDYAAIVRAHEFEARYDASNYAQFTSDNSSYLHLYLTGLTSGIAVNAHIVNTGSGKMIGSVSYPWDGAYWAGPQVWPGGLNVIPTGNYYVYVDTDEPASSGYDTIGRTASTERIKKNRRRYQPTDPEALLKVEVAAWDWDTDKMAKQGFEPMAGGNYGLFAEDLLEHAPELVGYKDGKVFAFMDAKLPFYQIIAMQAMDKRLTDRLGSIEDRLFTLEGTT